MGQIKRVEVVMAICGIVSRHLPLLQWSVEQLASCWGGLTGPPQRVPFGAQAYYEEEMGTDLQKWMVCGMLPRDPAELADWKRFTTQLEERARGEGLEGGEKHPQSRPLNLDPGYISQGKLVLASVKDRDHRVYLRDGIFAEVTLRYSRQGWVVNPWTYRDYRTPEMWAFADVCRGRLRDYLTRSGGFRR